MRDNLSEFADLQEVIPTLADADGFVRQMLGNRLSYHRDGRQVLSRLGIRGTGQYPNYRFDDDGGPVRAFDGGNHKPFPERDDITSPVNWSKTAMSLDDVRAALARIRGKPLPV